MWMRSASLYIGITAILLSVFSNTIAQKVFYDPAVKDWLKDSPPTDSSLVHSIFLIGDIKYPSQDKTVMKLLKSKLDEAPPGSSLLLLGDIVYPRGFASDDSRDYPGAKADLDAILEHIEDFEGNIVFIPGNHDWMRGHKEGQERLQLMQEYIIDKLGSENTFLPHDGCPGPVEIQLTDDVVAIVFDSQWWLHMHEKPGPDECDFEEESGLFVQIEDIIRRNKGKSIIFAAHHPLFTVGYHGGYFPTEWNFFPMLERNKYLYVPLPGFIYTGYRKYLGHIQDLAHPRYKELKKSLLSVFEKYPNLIYAAGHEHNLQYFEYKKLHQVISGGGGEGTHISKRKSKTDFAIHERGFAVLNYYKNGDVWVSYYTPGTEASGKLVFRKMLFNTKSESFTPSNIESLTIPRDTTTTAKISDIYQAGNFVKFWMGKNYREEWKTVTTFPVFDIQSEQGGLTILKRGGGQQTKSVRMENDDGKQYVLRSVNKFVEGALDDELQHTIAQDIVQDGVSASHPYAAITIPKMADAINILHTNPSIVWVPDDPALGIYRKDLANNVFLYEERPDGNRKDVDSFRNSEDIESTHKVISKIQKDHDHIVDQKLVLRSRLFDILINDWDRHDDQWRWASFKENGKTTYLPIPRDRDQVYFLNEGVLMWIAGRNFIQPKFQGFDYTIENVKGLGYNARFFDRTFISQPDLDDWLNETRLIQRKLTDSIIHEAINCLPEEIYEISGKEIEEKLKSRRDSLHIYSKEYYLFLSKEVDIVGTDQDETFKITRHENGDTEIKVFQSGNKEELLYSRLFHIDETKEIRLYGLKGEDNFEINGTSKDAILLRIIAGKDNDLIEDKSSVKGLRKTIKVYERKDKKNKMIPGRETKLIMSKDKLIDDYNRKQYKYDKTMPLISAGYNIDDGIIIGGGADIKTYNFRDSTQQRITGSFAFATKAYSFNYDALVTSFSRYFDYVFKASVSVPRNTDNYFGMGNETKRITDNKFYYRVRYQYAYINPMLKHSAGKSLNYKIGGFYQYFKVQDTSGRYIGDIGMNDLDTSAFRKHHFAGMNIEVEIDTRDNTVLPKRGIHWISDAAGFYGLDKSAKDFVRMRSDMRLYFSFSSDPRFVLAVRFGGAINIGNYEFYHANTLGGKTNLRGFQSRRFAGDKSFYQNTELRIKLLNLRNYLVNGQMGVYVFNDVGRVWLKGEHSERWHDGFGGGLWFTPYDFTALTLSYHHSYEDSMVAFNFRFIF